MPFRLGDGGRKAWRSLAGRVARRSAGYTLLCLVLGFVIDEEGADLCLWESLDVVSSCCTKYSDSI